MRIPCRRSSRAQITGFAIFGIFLLVIVILLFLLRERIAPFLPGPLGGKIQTVEQHIGDCLRQKAPPLIERIGLQGGYLSTPQGTFRLHQDVPISYLCYDIERAAACRNRMLTLQNMETQLADALAADINTCIDFSIFKRRGYQMSIGERNIDIIIGLDRVIVDLNQPLRLTKGDEVIEQSTFTETFSYPLGRLYDVSQDVVNAEATLGSFDQLPYILAHKGTYIIDKKKPYPDILYILTTKDSPYIFQFFIEGEPTPL